MQELLVSSVRLQLLQDLMQVSTIQYKFITENRDTEAYVDENKESNVDVICYMSNADVICG